MYKGKKVHQRQTLNSFLIIKRTTYLFSDKYKANSIKNAEKSSSFRLYFHFSAENVYFALPLKINYQH